MRAHNMRNSNQILHGDQGRIKALSVTLTAVE